MFDVQLVPSPEIRYTKVFAQNGPSDHGDCTVTVGAPVAGPATKTERQRVVFKVVPSRSMHWPSTLARGATGEAVLTLEMHSREPYGHASRPRPSARRRLWRPRLRDDRRF